MKRLVYPAIAALLFIVLLAAWYLRSREEPPPIEHQASSQPQIALKQYLTAVYARDYKAAYQWISGEDRKVKSLDDYLRENTSFPGTVLGPLRALAQRIEISNVSTTSHGAKITLRFHLQLPDASDPSLQKIFMDFDPDRLSALAAEESQAMEQQINALAKNGKLPMLEGEEQWEMIREANGWRVYLNWVGATRVLFAARVMEGLPWSFEPMQAMVSANPGETLQAIYKAKNLSSKSVTAKARHIDEPKELASKHLEIIQCFCFIQQTLAPGEEKEFPLLFRVNWDTPAEAKEFRVVYEFYPIDKFPKN